ncbi:MAG: hypothetical protein AAF492_29930, partial [Verrucomicrobiota bacterium]
MYMYIQRLHPAGATHVVDGPEGCTPPPRQVSAEPAFTLNRKIHTEGNTRPSDFVVTPYRWSTTLDVNISQVPTPGGGFEAFIYNVQGTTETEKHVLASLLDHSETIENLFLLYPSDKAEKGQKAVSISMVSDHEPTAFMVHTNGATASQPPPTFDAFTRVVPSQRNASDPYISFMEQLWQVDQVQQGGYFLYYRTSATGAGRGLPDYLFAQQPSTRLSLVVTHVIQPQYAPTGPSYPLPGYVNSVIMDTAIDPKNESVFVQPLGPTATYDPLLQIKSPTINPGFIGFEFTRPNPNAPPPTGLTGAALAEHQLQELYSMLEVEVPEQTGWKASKPGLPVGPRNPETGATGIPSTFQYDIAFEVARLAGATA